MGFGLVELTLEAARVKPAIDMTDDELADSVAVMTSRERTALIDGRVEDALVAGTSRLEFIAEMDRRRSRDR